jgi:demethylmenaquinone methyltransferase/2-methoxy-6-polyprenyl-1,4-benzoquinol methylase
MTQADDVETQTDFGFETVALGAKQGLVDQVFDTVAGRYDIMNDLMSGGLHRAWKAAMVGQLALPRGARRYGLLDVAGGTGDIAFRALATGGAGVHATLLDINGAMLEVGRARALDRGLGGRVDAVQASAEALPFADGSFDGVTIAFGLRNVPRIQAGLNEMRRVLRPGGRFLCLEFSPSLTAAALKPLYDAFSFHLIPRIGRVVAGDAEPYRYLVESIRRFAAPEDLAEMMRTAGFDRVRWTPYTGGVANLHAAWRL